MNKKSHLKIVEQDSDVRGGVVIYQDKDRSAQFEVRLEQETVWLTQKQMGELFDKDVRTINEHILNIFKEKELKKNSVIRKFRITARDGKSYNTNFYNLDAIISVGYRINSKRGTQFRIWATNVLKKHLVHGFTLNEKRLRVQTEKLEVLRKAIGMITDIKERKELGQTEALGLLDVIGRYSYALGVLDDYDHGRIAVTGAGSEEKYVLTYEAATVVIHDLKKIFGGSALFGYEKDGSFRSSVAAIYQTFDGRDLYPLVEQKAAQLLYFIIKDHSFTDGNKRIAAAVFLWFLERNGLLFTAAGVKRIDDKTLVALTLMIAESRPDDRVLMVSLVVNLIMNITKENVHGEQDFGERQGREIW